MPEQEKKSRVFPLVDRRTPVLDRIRNGSGDGGEGKKLGVLIGKSIISEDREGVEEKAKEVEESVKAGLAEALGVSVDDIDNSVPRKIRRLITDTEEEDALTKGALENLGLLESSPEPEEEESGEDSEEDDFF